MRKRDRISFIFASIGFVLTIIQILGALRAIAIVSTESSKMDAVTHNLRPKSSESKLIPMKGSNTREKKKKIVVSKVKGFKGTVKKKMKKTKNKAVPKVKALPLNHVKDKVKTSGIIIKGKEKAVPKMKISSSNRIKVKRTLVKGQKKKQHTKAQKNTKVLESTKAALSVVGQPSSKTQFTYIFVGGLQRSMTTTVTEALGDSIKGSSLMKISNMEKAELMSKKSWELGMGKLSDEDINLFFKNSGGLEGKMVQDVYSKTGEYVDFLKTYCAVGPPNDGCKEHKAVPSLVKTEKDLAKLNVNQVRKRLLQQWGSFWDSSSTIRFEKTPENVFMTRWLQKVFGPNNTHFLIQMTHPLVWSLKIDKWVKKASSSLWPITSRIEAWLETYENLVDKDLPELKSVALSHVEHDFHPSDFAAFFNLPHMKSTDSKIRSSSQGYIQHFCQGTTKTPKGTWANLTQAQERLGLGEKDIKIKFDGSLNRSRQLLKKYECRANKFGYSFWGVDVHCRNSYMNYDSIGYAPALINKGLRQMMPYNTSPYRGKHIVVFGHNFSTGINTGMAKRFAKIVEAFLKMGVTIHYICQECVESSVGQFTEDWFNVQPFGYIMNVYPGSTTQDQVDSMLAHGDDCLPDKIVAVLSFVTHLGMNIQRHYNKLKKKKVTKEQQLKWESMDFDDGIEHEALVESMKSRGVSLPVIIVSDDVHWDRNAVGYNMKEDNKPQHEIDNIKQWVRKREMRIYGKANVVVAVSKEDADAFQKLALSYNKKIPTRMIVAPYTAQDTKDQSSISPFQERKNQLLIVGNPHRIAFDSMVWFLSEVWPVLRVKKPELRFKIVGKRWQLLLDRSSLNMTSSSTPMDWASIGIDFMEFVEQEDLDNKLFQESKVFLVPHKNATGVSTKIIEALSRGIPIVTNSWGKQGLNLEANDSPDDVLFATDSNDAFIKGIINLLDNKKAWDTMSLAGLHHAKTHLNEDVVFKAMMSALKEGSADINMASSSRRLSEPLRRRLPQTFPSWIEQDHMLEETENLKGQENTLEKRWSRRALEKYGKKRKQRKKMSYPWIKTKTYPWVDEKRSSQDASGRTRPWGKRKKYSSKSSLKRYSSSKSKGPQRKSSKSTKQDESNSWWKKSKAAKSHVRKSSKGSKKVSDKSSSIDAS